MIIKKGRLYRRRDGQVVLCNNLDMTRSFPVEAGGSDYTIEGFFDDRKYAHQLDLIEELEMIDDMQAELDRIEKQFAPQWHPPMIESPFHLQPPQVDDLDYLAEIHTDSIGEVTEAGKKFDTGKLPLELISPTSLNAMAAVLAFGAKKYDARNWEKGIAYSRIIGAIMRHTNAYLSGEVFDKETGLSHMAHVMTEAMFILHFEKHRPEFNDLPKESK